MSQRVIELNTLRVRSTPNLMDIFSNEEDLGTHVIVTFSGDNSLVPSWHLPGTDSPGRGATYCNSETVTVSPVTSARVIQQY